MLFPDIDWWCDCCIDSLNSQDGFYDECGTWECKKCGCINFINADNIFDISEMLNTEIETYEDIYNYPGCVACDNPNFPKCKTSCPMFDD